MNRAVDDLYLTTKELAELLRIKERKVYEMASAGEVPCVRVVGKLLFPRAQITLWMHAAYSGPPLVAAKSCPATLVGSHDPLLEWAMRESQCGLASSCDGSRDGLLRMADNEAIVCGTHLHEDGGWNIATVQALLSDQSIVLVEFAKRSRGLIITPEKSSAVTQLDCVCGLRVAQRQAAAASQQLFDAMLKNIGIGAKQLKTVAPCARTEDELGMLVFEGKADVAFGLESVAQRLQLPFLPLLQERFDLVVDRKSWFEKPFQTLVQFMQGDLFKERASDMGGYDISALGAVRYNSPAE